MTDFSGSSATSTVEHYTTDNLRERLETALRANGKDLDALSPADLRGFEHFHALGIAGTAGLLHAAIARPDERVLDAGAGVGGTSRMLATEHGCRVTAVDLTPEYCEVMRWLNALVGLDIEVLEGDVTHLPVADTSFDLVVSQHVQMNVADKATLYSEAHRVLTPGGRLAIWDILAGPNQPITFPVPWADTPAHSHLVTPDQLRASIEHAGFDITVWNDLTEFAVQAMTQQFDTPPDPLGLQLVVPDIAVKGRAILTNATEHRLRLIQAVAVAR